MSWPYIDLCKKEDSCEDGCTCRYEGPNLPCTGISTGDCLDLALQKIDAVLCGILYPPIPEECLFTAEVTAFVPPAPSFDVEVLIKLLTSGPDAGPFEFYSDVDGFAYPFKTNVSKLELLLGYTAFANPGTTIVKIVSKGVCTNYIDVNIVFTDCSEIEGTAIEQ